jgi:hypothetical protein
MAKGSRRGHSILDKIAKPATVLDMAAIEFEFRGEIGVSPTDLQLSSKTRQLPE